MSPDILYELQFLLHSFLIGILITILYDLFRILRRVIPHNVVAVSIEDILYWSFCSLLIFVLLVKEHNGVLRWFAVAGAGAGMLLYKKTLGNFFVHYISLLFCKLLHLVGRILKAILRPLNMVKQRMYFMGKKTQKPLKMGIRRGKKKLTQTGKLLKMILYKR